MVWSEGYRLTFVFRDGKKTVKDAAKEGYEAYKQEEKGKKESGTTK